MEIAKSVLWPAEAEVSSQNSEVKQEDARKVAQEFEAVFLSQAVDEMMKTVEMGGFGGGAGEEQWKSFLSREFANEIARGRTTGIAQSVETMLKAYQS